jgi:hypothetical protein
LNIRVLKKYGFVKAGEWKFGGRARSGIACMLSNFADDRVIYAFVINESVKYTGICQNLRTTLKKRMSRYVSGSGRKDGKFINTNKRVQNNIGKTLKKTQAWKYMRSFLNPILNTEISHAILYAE